MLETSTSDLGKLLYEDFESKNIGGSDNKKMEKVFQTNNFLKMVFKILKQYFKNKEDSKKNILKYFNIVKKRVNNEFIEDIEKKDFLNLVADTKFETILDNLPDDLGTSLTYKQFQILFEDNYIHSWIIFFKSEFNKKTVKILESKRPAEILNNNKKGYDINSEREPIYSLNINGVKYNKLKITIDGEDKYCLKKEDEIGALKITDFIYDEINIIQCKEEYAKYNEYIRYKIGNKYGIVKIGDSTEDKIIYDYVGNPEYEYFGLFGSNNTFYYVCKKDGSSSICEYGKENNVKILSKNESIRSLKIIGDDLYYMYNKDKKSFIGKYNESDKNELYSIPAHFNSIDEINGKPFIKKWSGDYSYYREYGKKSIKSPNIDNVKNCIILEGTIYFLIEEGDKIGYVNYETKEKLFSTEHKNTKIELKNDENGAYISYFGEIKNYFNQPINESK